MDGWWAEPESFEAAKRELDRLGPLPLIDDAGDRLRFTFLKGYVTGGQRAVMRMQTTGTWEPVPEPTTPVADWTDTDSGFIQRGGSNETVTRDFDPTDSEQGPLERGWAASRRYNLEKGVNPHE